MIGLKLKKGDLVVCLKDYPWVRMGMPAEFTQGKVYKVINFGTGFNYNQIIVEADDSGKQNWLFSKCFIKINDCKLSRLVYNVRI